MMEIISKINLLVYHLVLLSIIEIVKDVESHGRLMKPPSRSSIWRIPEFHGENPPDNYNDNELFCGSVHQEDDPGRQCGVCGDPLSEPKPRDNEIGGKWYRGIITGRYRAGQVIEVEVELTRSHKGAMEWRLCSEPGEGGKGETQDCFNRHVLRLADGGGNNNGGTKLPVNLTGMYKTKLKLPDGVTCSHCVLQWNYRAGNNWGTCRNGTSSVGCGPQETFRGCADVSIMN